MFFQRNRCFSQRSLWFFHRDCLLLRYLFFIDINVFHNDLYEFSIEIIYYFYLYVFSKESLFFTTISMIFPWTLSIITISILHRHCCFFITICMIIPRWSLFTEFVQHYIMMLSVIMLVILFYLLICWMPLG